MNSPTIQLVAEIHLRLIATFCFDGILCKISASKLLLISRAGASG